MALIKCPECEHAASDNAEMCPNCGFPIKKDLENKKKLLEEEERQLEKEKKREELQKKKAYVASHKGRILVITLLIIAGICLLSRLISQATRPQVHIADFMADMDVSIENWEEYLDQDATYKINDDYTIYFTELIEGVYGELNINTHSQELDYWTWTVSGDNKKFKKIRRGLSRLTSDYWSQYAEGYDAWYVFKWVEYNEENAGIGKWTIGDTPMTMEMVEDERHLLLLLKKGDTIEIQYKPINSDHYHSIDYLVIE